MKTLLKTKLLDARRSRDEVAANIYRVVLGQIELEEGRGKTVNETNIQKMVKKLIASNEETIAVQQQNKLQRENELLRSLLPRELNASEFEAELLNGDDPHFEMIRDAKTHGAAMGVAMKFAASRQLTVPGAAVKDVVNKIRETDF